MFGQVYVPWLLNFYLFLLNLKYFFKAKEKVFEISKKKNVNQKILFLVTKVSEELDSLWHIKN